MAKKKEAEAAPEQPAKRDVAQCICKACGCGINEARRIADALPAAAVKVIEEEQDDLRSVQKALDIAADMKRDAEEK